MIRPADDGASSEAAAPKKTRVIAVGNQKGGVGKTTNTVHLAVALAERGRQVLIWDLDMNHGSTRHFGLPPEAFLGTFEVLMGEESALDVVVTKDEPDVEVPDGVHLIPASRKLEQIDEALTAKNKFLVRQNVLKEPLEELRGKYDYIFLDTAPNATTPTIAAYAAADWFLLSAIPEPFAIDGLSDALTDIQNAQRFGNEKLTLLGVVVAGVAKRTKLATALTHYIDQTFTLPDGKSLKFKTEIGRCTYIPTAQKEGTTILGTHPKHKVAEQYRALAREVERRFQDLEREAKPQAGGRLSDAQPERAAANE